MVKKDLSLLLIVFSFFAICRSHGQNAYQDALEIQSLSWEYDSIDNIYVMTDTVAGNIMKLNDVLNNYFHKDATPNQKKEALINNPFFKIPESQIMSLSEEAQELLNTSTISKSISSIGNLNVTNLADGFAKFIVERTKQELSITFFEKFKEELDEYEDLKSIFPQTYRSLKAIDNEIYMFNAYIQTLRESFEKDLSQLPAHLPEVIDNNKEYFDKNKGLEAVLSSCFYLIGSIQDKLHPGIIIENFPVENLEGIDPNFKAAFQTLQLFSTSIKADGSDNYWISVPETEKLYQDEILQKLYFGLIYQQAEKGKIKFISNGAPLELSTIIDSSFSNDNSSISFIKNMCGKIQNLNDRISKLNRSDNDSLKIEKYYGVFSASIDLMEYSLEINKLSYFPEEYNFNPEKVKKYFDMAQTASDIAIDVNRRNYSSAIVNSLYLYDLVFSKEYFSQFSVNIDVNSLDTIFEKASGAGDALFKYGTFMALLVEANSSDEVAGAIEAFALPAGSARIKRESAFNVSLNAYCGLFYGYEKIKGVDGGVKEINLEFDKWNSYGVSAPIGIAISAGNILKGVEKNWSHTLFLSVVDIGALAAFRFTDDDVESVPEIKLKDIVSPGIFYSLGIPRSPISINVGYQMGPLLREINIEDNANVYADSYSRFSIALTVDIPLINFYTKVK